MQTLLRMLTVAGVVCAATMTVVHAQQVPSPTTAAEVPGPAPGTAMTKAYMQTVGRMAYVWGWSLVNMSNRFAAFTKAPEPGLLDGLPVAYNGLAMLTGYIAPSQRVVTCPNQDVVYGAGFLALDKGPSFSRSGFRRSLLGLCALRRAHRRVVTDREAIRHQTRLLSDCRSELEGQTSQPASRRWCAPPPTMVVCRPAHFHGRHG